MPVELNGSCHCGLVRFSVMSSTPVPYQLCTCSICRKCGGVGGSINLGADYTTLKIHQGKDYIKGYQAVLNRDTKNEKKANSKRSFCGECSAMLWLWDSHWPDLCHPFASAIDSELKTPKSIVVVKLDSKPDYVRLPEGKREDNQEYGNLSISDWHKENGELV